MLNTSQTIRATALAAFVAFSGGASAAQLVSNGDFTLGDTDWTATAGTTFASGAAALTGKGATLFQTLTNLVIGQDYDFTFNYNRTDGSGTAIKYDLSGATSFSGTGFNNNVLAVLPTYSFTATSNNLTISFAGFNGKTAVIDNVSILGPVAAVPEPETYAMLLAGLGMMGALARRQKKA